MSKCYYYLRKKVTLFHSLRQFHCSLLLHILPIWRRMSMEISFHILPNYITGTSFSYLTKKGIEPNTFSCTQFCTLLQRSLRIIKGIRKKYVEIFVNTLTNVLFIFTTILVMHGLF